MASQVPPEFQQYVHLPWDEQFLANETYHPWFRLQIEINPVPPGQPLSEYVRSRVAAQKEAVEAAAAADLAAQQQDYLNDDGQAAGDDVNEIFDMTSYAPDDSSVAADSFASTSYAATSAPNGGAYDYSSHIHPNPVNPASLQFSSSSYSADPTSYVSINPASINPSDLSHSFLAATTASNGSSNTSKPSAALEHQRASIEAEQKRAVAAAAAGAKAKSSKAPVASTSSAKPSTSSSAKASSSKSATSTSSAAAAATTAAPNRARTETPPIASTSSSSAPLAEAAWTKILPTLRESLTAVRFQKASLATAGKLAQVLKMFQLPEGKTSPWNDSSEVPPLGRLEVLEAMRKYARDDFWNQWLGKGADGGMETLVAWLKGALLASQSTKAFHGKDDLAATMVPLLKIFTKLPLTLDHLRKYSIGARVKRIGEKSSNLEAKGIASTLTHNWTILLKSAAVATPKAAGAASAGVKKEGTSTAEGKRKSTDATAEGPKKKVKPAAPAATTTTTKSSTTSTSAPTSAAAMFSKTTLPSFKKEKKPDVPALGPMQQALIAMGKATASSRGKSGASPIDAKPPGGTAGFRKGKAKKSVQWAKDDELEQVKFILRADYGKKDGEEGRLVELGEETEGDAEEGGMDHDANARAMQEQERYMHLEHMEEDLEEEIDWYEPPALAFPTTEEFQAFLQPREDTPQVIEQTERESKLMAVDVLESSEPDASPSEPPAEEVPADQQPPIVIPLCDTLRDDPAVQHQIATAQLASTPAGGFAANDQIASLLGQLTGHNPASTAYNSNSSAPPAFNEATLAQLRTFDPSLIQSVVASQPRLQELGNQLNQFGGLPLNSPYSHPRNPTPVSTWGSSAPPPPSYSAWHDTPSSANAYNGYVPPAPTPLPPTVTHSTRKSSHKGRKKVDTPCKFFRSSRGCDVGDKCPFVHQ